MEYIKFLVKNTEMFNCDNKLDVIDNWESQVEAYEHSQRRSFFDRKRLGLNPETDNLENIDQGNITRYRGSRSPSPKSSKGSRKSQSRDSPKLSATSSLKKNKKGKQGNLQLEDKVQKKLKKVDTD